MDHIRVELFTGMLETNANVFCHSVLYGVFTIFLHNSSYADYFMKEFTHWNESHGVPYSLIKISATCFIVYSDNGVKISDLTR